MIRIPVHSFCNLITNSSTTIYSWYDGSVPAVKELLQSIIDTFGLTEKVDDLFHVGAFLYPYTIYEWAEDFEGAPEFKDSEEVETLVEEILSGKHAKPQWMLDMEERAKGYDNYQNIDFFIKAKDPKYEDLAEKIKEFLFSVTSEDSYG